MQQGLTQHAAGSAFRSKAERFTSPKKLRAPGVGAYAQDYGTMAQRVKAASNLSSAFVSNTLRFDVPTYLSPETKAALRKEQAERVRRDQRFQRIREHNAALALQAGYRAICTRRHVAPLFRDARAATRLQKLWRGRTGRLSALRATSALALLQRVAAGCCARRLAEARRQDPAMVELYQVRREADALHERLGQELVRRHAFNPRTVAMPPSVSLTPDCLSRARPNVGSCGVRRRMRLRQSRWAS